MSDDSSFGGNGDNPLVPGRFDEKSQLQNINQRFSNYIYTIRQQREQQVNKDTSFTDERKWINQIETMRSAYDQHISDLQSQLDHSQHEKAELEASRAKYDSISAEFEGRILSLNEAMLKQNDQITKLQHSLASKELELQQVQTQLTGPRAELEACKMERDDMKLRLAETERRFQTEQKEKNDCEQHLSDFHARCNREILMYQQEIDDLHGRLENSRHLVLELEETVRKSGQQNGDAAEMMRKAREASEMELRRFMDETESKHQLNMSEIRMQMEADANNVIALGEENRQLQTDLNNTITLLNTTQSKLASIESAYKVSQTSLESERKRFETQLRKLNSKLQKTQDLLVIKLKELSAAQDANIPLKTEIDLLRKLLEEEEIRLGMNGSQYSVLKGISNGQMNSDGDDNQWKILNGKEDYSRSQKDSSKQNGNCLSISPLYQSALSQGPTSVPLATQGFIRGPPGSTGVNMFRAPLAGSQFDENGLKHKDAETLSAQSEEEQESGDAIRRRISDSRLNRANSRSGNLTPKMLPRRPASAIGLRYVPGDAVHGKDYFDAMFNDLRKDTMYTKVTEADVGVDSAEVTSYSKGHAAHSSGNTVGNLKLAEVDKDGKCVRLHNTSATITEDIGGCLIQQNLAGHPVTLFRFPPRTKLSPGFTTTIWSATCDEKILDPPFNYIAKKQDKWEDGTDCTTLFCRPNGQAVAWVTATPRTPLAYQRLQPDMRAQTTEMERLQYEYQFKRSNQQKDEAKYRGLDSDQHDRAILPVPSSYKSGPVIYSDAASPPLPKPILKRDKCSRILPTRTGSAPLRRYIPPSIPLR